VGNLFFFNITRLAAERSLVRALTTELLLLAVANMEQQN
jgi:hypothetical protein